MNERDAKVILKPWTTFEGLHSPDPFVCWYPPGESVLLDGSFTADELAALAWWMKREG